MGNETSKLLFKPNRSAYLQGDGIDIGSGTDCYPGARPWDRADGDAVHMMGVPDDSHDYVYSSHCLEHLTDVPLALKNWLRILRPGAYLMVIVPDYTLYEQHHWPSIYSGDHRQSFSEWITRSQTGRDNHWCIPRDVVPVLQACGADLIASELECDGYDFNRGTGDQTRGPAVAQIMLLARKS